MPPRPGKGEGVSLLEHDEVKNAANEHELETLNLAGAIDILWQIKGVNSQKSENVSLSPEQSRNVQKKLQPLPRMQVGITWNHYLFNSFWCTQSDVQHSDDCVPFS
jgi:hypothetical protein